ncbi:MAG: phosphoenolpyruvate--protein phosphotransferase [Planctomycetes bacterium]|nr:phosphoenolpyruvate--protein phosphotransferase [Planctomycetota bacterium]
MTRLELKGLPVAPGIVVGPAVLVDAAEEVGRERRITPTQVDAAVRLFEGARQRAIKSLEIVQGATAQELGLQDAAIFGAQIAVLQDPAALDEIRNLIRTECYAPESAIQIVVEKFSKLFDALEGGDIKNWAADLRDPWHAVQRELALDRSGELADPDGGPLILIAEELVPSLLTRVPRARLAGVVCARGGRFSHGAVVARSFGVPTVTGVEQIVARIEPGESMVLYADSGRVLLGADEGELISAAQRSEENAAIQDQLFADAGEAVVMRCGQIIPILVNVESPRDLASIDPARVDGVGLFRTEFAYMERPTFPAVSEQAELYREVLHHFQGKPVVFRTLDIGNDKQLRYFQTPTEANPALGWRGLRLGLHWKDLLLAQIQALIEAGDAGDVRVLLPMVTLREEIRETRALIQATLPPESQMPPLGCMIEVPAAAMALREIAPEVDFVSVGTNDLVQYLFAVDRDNPWVADLYQPYHPAHLRVLHHIAETCAEASTPVSVCGEMAGEMEGALFLVGAGFSQLSVATPFVPQLKAILRRFSQEELSDLARAASQQESAEESHLMLREAAERSWSEVVRERMPSRS